MRKKLIRPMIIGALPLLAAACAVGPHYKRPAADAPPAFKEPPPEGWKTAQPNDAALRGKWWEMFGDPQLSALIEQVSVSNQTIAQAEARFRGARAAVREVRAGLFPAVTAGASVTTARGSASRGNVNTAGTVTTYQVPIDVSYEADVWGRVRRGIEANVAEAQATAADLESIRLSLQAELAVDYFQIHGLDEQKQLLDTTAAAYERALQITVNRHDQGVASGADVAQAQTQLETTRAQAIDLGVNRAALEHAIAILTGKAPAELTLPPATSRYRRRSRSPSRPSSWSAGPTSPPRNAGWPPPTPRSASPPPPTSPASA
jgi:NodT family efflux transporter outer membrane factor (OMF) lipoprotein